MDQSKTDRKADIVRAAFDALMAGGLPMVSYDSIAAQGGMSRQLIRYHYGDTEDLMVDLCDHLAGVYREALISEVMKSEGRARLTTFFDFYFDLLENNRKPRDDQVYDALMALSAGSGRIKSTLRTQYSLLGQVLSHELQLEFPQLGSQGADELSYLFVCLMYGHWKMVASLGFAEDHRHMTRTAVERLLDSYLADSDSVTSTKTWSGALSD